MDFAHQSISAPVAYGLDVRKPWAIRTRSTGSILDGLRDGEWSEPVNRLRGLVKGTAAFQEAKLDLPYFRPAGDFSYSNKRLHLASHAAQMVIDLDDLGPQQCLQVIAQAVQDPYVIAAFHSASGQGVKLLFRLSRPLSAAEHRDTFPMVARYVEREFGVKVDPSGSDVVRACFVTVDRGIWLNPSAIALPLSLPVIPAAPPVNAIEDNCVNQGLARDRELRELPWRVGKACVPGEDCVRPDGSLPTCKALQRLSWALAAPFARAGRAVDGLAIGAAARAFLAEVKRRGHRVRMDESALRAELRKMCATIPGSDRFAGAVKMWTRWPEHPEFPADGTPEERLLFAIERHCAEHQTRRFYLGCRDAGLVLGASHVFAHRVIRRLVLTKRLQVVLRPKHPRHAITYSLMK